jgi:hypothetical protein
MKYKIGYIDEDPAQFKKYERDLREYFDVVGYDIKQGLPLDDLINQVYQSDIDLLMVDYLMVDYNSPPISQTRLRKNFCNYVNEKD